MFLSKWGAAPNPLARRRAGWVAQCYRIATFGGVYRAACRFAAPAVQESAPLLHQAKPGYASSASATSARCARK